MNEEKIFNIAFIIGFLAIGVYTLSSHLSGDTEEITYHFSAGPKKSAVDSAGVAVNFEGRVEGYFQSVSDGDTVRIKALSGANLKLRLNAIDAPESDQAHGYNAKAALSKLCLGSQFNYIPQGLDRYGRTVAIIFCNGVDVQAYMVENGHAWVYDKYVGGSQYLYPLQEGARQRRVGLWSGAGPISPWAWRAVHK